MEKYDNIKSEPKNNKNIYHDCTGSDDGEGRKIHYIQPHPDHCGHLKKDEEIAAKRCKNASQTMQQF